jgi:hypothetical protein
MKKHKKAKKNKKTAQSYKFTQNSAPPKEESLIKGSKRQLITAALALLAAGALMIFIGIGFTGFNKEEYTEISGHHWYRTIGFDSDGSFFLGWHN